MKEKIGIVMCGNSGVDYQTVDYPIEMIRSTLLLDGQEYEDYVDITAEEFYTRLVSNPNMDLSTSQTSTGTISKVYEKLKANGCTHILVITVSSKLSGTYQGAVLAKELLDNVKIHVVDSKSVSMGQVYLMNEALRMIKENKEFDTIVDKLEKMRDNTTIYVLVDTLKYLVKNGRLSSTSGFLGTLLKIKPLLVINEEGALVPYEKIRTTKKARSRLLEIIIEDIKGKNVDLFIAHTNNKEEAFEIKKALVELYPNLYVDIVPLTPVVGAHAGPGTLGLGYIIKN